MRAIALLTVLLSLTSLAFAPAPSPKRFAPQRVRQRELTAAAARLRELGARWEVVRLRSGQPAVRFEVSHPDGDRAMTAYALISGDDLAAALREAVGESERWLRRPGGRGPF